MEDELDTNLEHWLNDTERGGGNSNLTTSCWVCWGL